MAMLCLSIFYSYLLSYALGYVHSSIEITSCAQTPYPNVFEHYINTTLFPSKNRTPSSFCDLSISVTLDLAIDAHKKISSMTKKWTDEKSKLALVDCLEMYENTIEILNSSLNSHNPTKSQKWLNAAIAYHQICENGFNDFKLGHRLRTIPFKHLTDFTKMVSNSLAVNRALLPATSLKPIGSKSGSGRRLLRVLDGFPWWVSGDDRKILQGDSPKADFVVAQDGSGNYKTISDAVEAMEKKKKGSERFVVHVKKGVYKEIVEIKNSLTNVMFIGDGIDVTIVTGSKSSSDKITTFRTATFTVIGKGFIAIDITFENTAGPENFQAVAMASISDSSVFYRCSFKGYQDTLCVGANEQFYRDCDIYGTIDFIFGHATAVIQNCNIYVRKPMSKQFNVVTAHGREHLEEDSGIVIQNSVVAAAPDLKPVQKSFKTYLGRPWKKFARTVVIKSRLDELIDPEGWHPWNGSIGLDSLYYAEYMNYGSGADTGKRVNWPGYHVLTKADDAEKFTVGKFYKGDSWISDARVPFNAGL